MDGTVASGGPGGADRVSLEGWRVVTAEGPEARDFLHDLLTADVSSLEEGRSRRALLLTPTGRIRADLTVAAIGTELLLVQSPDQPDAIDDLLAPYVLSADVTLEDRSDDLRIVALPDADSPPPEAPRWYAPSALGPGLDLVLEPADALDVGGAWDRTEAARIAAGRARFPVDLTGRSLPNEAGLDRLIDVDKGCFLGQEAVAKVRNLGHPTHVVLSVAAGGPLHAGEDVLAGGDPVGTVTGAASTPGGWVGIVRVRWSAREEDLRAAGGSRLSVRGLASGA